MNTDKDAEIEDLRLQLDRYEKALRQLRNEFNILQSLYDVAIKERDYERQVNANLLKG